MVVFALLASPAARERWSLPERSAWSLETGFSGDRAGVPARSAREMLAERLAAPDGPCAGEEPQTLLEALLIEPHTGLDHLSDGGEVALSGPGETADHWLPPSPEETLEGWRGALLTVLSGPDAGRRIPLSRGRVILGREGDAVVADPEMSRRHALLEISPGAVRLRRLRGAAPVMILRDGRLRRPRGTGWARLEHGDVLLAGQSRILVTTGLPGGAGQGPRASSGPAGARGLAAASSSSRGSGEPMLAVIPAWRVLLAILPVVVSAIAALHWRQPMLMLFGLLSLGAGLGLWAERRGALRRRRQAAEREDAEDSAACEALFGPWRQHGGAPGAGFQHGGAPGAGFQSGGAAAGIGAGFGDEEKRRRRGVLNPVSISSESFRGIGAHETAGEAVSVRLGSVHPRAVVAAAARARGRVVPPQHLGILAGFGENPEAWTVRAPSVDPLGSLRAALLACRFGEPGREESPLHGSARLWVHPEEIDAAALSLPWVSASPSPALLHLCTRAECGEAASGRVFFERSGRPDPGLAWTADTVSLNRFLEECRRVRGQRDSGPADSAAPGGRDRWVFAPDAPDEAGVFDLERDGPHAMVVGTTGSGKTELLKTLVAAAALSQPPDALRLLLVDFKGGSGFAEFSDLPHVEQVVSNLDGAEIERVLLSLTADLERRERWLAEHGFADFRQARGHGDGRHGGGRHGGQVLPRLVVVIDELKALVDTVPAAAGQLARIAALGRSLGVNLVLASQRLQGAASSDLRANLGALFVLRVVSAQDSLDALGSSAAAEISRTSPGVLYLRAGGETRGPLQCRPWAESLLSRERLRPWPSPPGDAAFPEALPADATTLRALCPPVPVERQASPVWLPSIAPRMPAAPPPMGGQDCALLDDPGQQRRLLALGPENSLLVVGRAGPDRDRALVSTALASLIGARCGTAPADGRLILLAEDGLLPREIQSGCAAWAPPSDLLSVLELLEAVGPLRPGDCVVVPGLDGCLESLRSLGSGSGAEDFQRWLGAGLQQGARVLAGTSRLLGRVTDGFSAFAWMPAGVSQSLLSTWPVRQSVPERPGWALFTGRWTVRPETRAPDGELITLECSHVGVFAAVPDESAQPPGLSASGDLCPPPGAFRPLPAAAPPRPGLTELVRVRDSDGRPVRVAIGLTARAEPAWLDLVPGQVTAVLGAPGTGRTRVLAGIAAALGETLTPGEKSEPGWGLAGSCGGLHVLDDADAAAPGVLTAAEDHLRAGCSVLVSAPVRPGMALRRWLDLWRAPSCGVVLSPAEALDGEALGVRVTAFPTRDPGCGWLVSPSGIVRFRAWAANAAASAQPAETARTTGGSSARSRPSASRLRGRRARSPQREGPS